MRKLFSYFFVFIVIALLSQPTAAFFDDRVDKANKVISSQPEVAKQYLALVLNDPKASDEESYKAGLAFEVLGDHSSALASFRKMKARDFRQKAGNHYLHKGDMAVEASQFESAYDYYAAMADFEPALGAQTIDVLFKTGRDYWIAARGLSYQAWKLANRLEQHLTGKAETMVGANIADIYFEECNRAERPCFNYYRNSVEFSQKHKEEIKQTLSGLYTAQGISEKHQAEIRKELKLYCDSNNELDLLAPPNFVHLQLGESQTFSLAKGTYSKWFILKNDQSGEIIIMIPAGQKSMYSLQTRSGKIVKIWQGEKIKDIIGFLNEDFRLYAEQGDCVIRVVFSKK